MIRQHPGRRPGDLFDGQPISRHHRMDPESRRSTDPARPWLAELSLRAQARLVAEEVAEADRIARHRREPHAIRARREIVEATLSRQETAARLGDPSRALEGRALFPRYSDAIRAARDSRRRGD